MAYRAHRMGHFELISLVRIFSRFFLPSHSEEIPAGITHIDEPTNAWWVR